MKPQEFFKTDYDLTVWLDLNIDDVNLHPSEYYLNDINMSYEEYSLDDIDVDEKLKADIYEIFDNYIIYDFKRTFPNDISNLAYDLQKNELNKYPQYIYDKTGNKLEIIFVHPEDQQFAGVFNPKNFKFESIYFVDPLKEQTKISLMTKYNKEYTQYLFKLFRNYLDNLTLNMFAKHAEIILKFIEDDQISINFVLYDNSHFDYIGVKDDFATLIFRKNKSHKILFN